MIIYRKKRCRRAARATRRTRTQASPEEPRHRLLELQRQVGNAVVARLIQRTPRDRPQSTDAPWVKRPKRPKPKPAKKLPDIRARVIKYEIDKGRTLITIGSGPEQGVQVGMIGSLVHKDGREVTQAGDFTIESAVGRISRAYIDAIPDQIIADPQVVIKASRFEPESMEGKEF